jgi:hypothetical protein
MTAMRQIVALAFVCASACGGKSPPPPPPPGAGSADPVGVVQDTRTPLAKRRDAACEALGPKLTQCAVDDVRAKHAAGKITQQQLDQDTKPEIQSALTADWTKQCRVEMSSRQVRVLEVCFREETACGPLQDCLLNLQPQAK